MEYALNLILFAILCLFTLVTSEGPILETPQGTLQGISLKLEDGKLQLIENVGMISPFPVSPVRRSGK